MTQSRCFCSSDTKFKAFVVILKPKSDKPRKDEKKKTGMTCDAWPSAFNVLCGFRSKDKKNKKFDV